MKKHLKCAFSLLIIVLVFVSFSSVNAQKSNSLKLEKLKFSKIPVGVKSVSIGEVDNRAVLVYSLDGQGKGFSKFELVAFTLTSSGEVKGGQGWTLSIDEEINASAQQSVVLANKPMTGDRVILAVVKAEGRLGTTKVSPKEITDQLKIHLGRTTTRNVRSETQIKLVKTTAQVLTAGDACDRPNCIARNSCGCGGISSFSCNPQTGVYSYSCYPRNGCTDAPEDNCEAN